MACALETGLGLLERLGAGQHDPARVRAKRAAGQLGHQLARLGELIGLGLHALQSLQRVAEASHQRVVDDRQRARQQAGEPLEVELVRQLRLAQLADHLEVLLVQCR